MVQKCVHKGCGKVFDDSSEDCIYHPGPPVFHEGQKGWKCCKTRVLTFDEFLTIPPCTTGNHSTVDDTPAPEPKSISTETVEEVPKPKPMPNGASQVSNPTAQARPQQTQQHPTTPPAPPESDSDDPVVAIPAGKTCRRRACGATYDSNSAREDEKCVYHPGQALFHEGTKGWTCCKRRVLEFDDFMRIEGCKIKGRHLFVGSGKGKGGRGDGEEAVGSARHDFYQTPTSVIASIYLKKINALNATVAFTSPLTVDLDLPTTDKKRYKASLPLYAPIDIEKSTFKIMGTKLELTLVKADGSGWPVFRSDERTTGEIIQVGKAGRA